MFYTIQAAYSNNPGQSVYARADLHRYHKTQNLLIIMCSVTITIFCVGGFCIYKVVVCRLVKCDYKPQLLVRSFKIALYPHFMPKHGNKISPHRLIADA